MNYRTIFYSRMYMNSKKIRVDDRWRWYQTFIGFIHAPRYIQKGGSIFSQRTPSSPFLVNHTTAFHICSFHILMFFGDISKTYGRVLTKYSSKLSLLFQTNGTVETARSDTSLEPFTKQIIMGHSREFPTSWRRRDYSD